MFSNCIERLGHKKNKKNKTKKTKQQQTNKERPRKK